MKRYRDPTPALTPPERPLPLRERIACAVVLTIVVGALIWTVWLSVKLGLPRR